MTDKELHERDDLETMLEQPEAQTDAPNDSNDPTPDDGADPVTDGRDENPSDEMTREKRGLIREIQAERERVRLLREENERLRLMFESEKERQGGAKAKHDPESTDSDGEDDDTLLTKRELKALLVKEREARQLEEAEKEAKVKQAIAQKSYQRAVKDYTAEKAGKGLDYQTVVTTGKDYLRRGDLEEIQESEDPARTMYELCLIRSPELRKRQQLLEREKLLIEVRGGRRIELPKGGGRSPKSVMDVLTQGGGDAEMDRLLSKSQEELLAMLSED